MLRWASYRAAALVAAGTLAGCGSSDRSPGITPVTAPPGTGGATTGVGGTPVTSTAGSTTVLASGGVTGAGAPAAAGSVPVVVGAGGTVSGGTTSAGASGSGGASGGAGSAPVIPDPNVASLSLDPFTVQPGQEVIMCQDFDNPFGGQDVAIVHTESDMTPGSHHLHVFYGADSPPSKTIAPCANPLEFRSLLHIAVAPHYEITYPAGMAARLRGSLGLRLQSHYINTTTDPLDAMVTVRLKKTDPTTIQNWVAQFYYDRVQLSVPPGANQQVTTSCTVPGNYGKIGLLSAISHMHSRGTHFVASTSTGVKLIETDDWEGGSPIVYDPPVMLSPGDSVTWTCTYNNTTGQTLVFGDSAAKNEMCIYIARFYSSPDGNDIECQSPYPMGMGAVTRLPAGM